MNAIRTSTPTMGGRTPIPVLLYHGVATAPYDWIAPFTVSPAAFERHLELIAASGRIPVTVEQLRTGLGTRHFVEAEDRLVVLTFDDGFTEWADIVAPLLDRARIQATMFLTTAFIGNRSPGGDRMLSWSAAAELAAAGHEIGAHSVTHPQLDTLPGVVARSEIVGSRRHIEDRLALPVSSFAYPHGYSKRSVRDSVRAAGFEVACSVQNAFSHPDDAAYRIARLTVMAHTTDDQLRGWLAGQGAPLASGRESLKTSSWRLYRTARAVLRRPERAAW